MMKKPMTTTSRKLVNQATTNAAVFLLAPHECPQARAAAMADASHMVRSAIRLLVKAGRDDLATTAQDLALTIESQHG